MDGSTPNAAVGSAGGSADVNVSHAGSGDSNVRPGSVSPGGIREPAHKAPPDNKGHAGAAKKDAGEKPDAEGKGEAAAAEKLEAAAKAPARKVYKLPNDDGTDEEVDEPEVKRRILHAREANKRMEEAATTQRRMQEFIDHLTSDPLGVLDRLAQQKRLKVDPIEAMERRLAEHYKRQLMTPEQVEQEQAQAKAKAYDQWQASQAEEAEAKKLSDAQQHFEVEYDKKISAVLTTAGLPKRPGTVKQVAALMEVALQKGYEPDLNLIVDIVRKNYHQDTKELYSHLDGEELLATLGEEIANKIRKYDLSRLKGRFQAEAPKSEPKPRQSASKERLNPRDFFEQAMKRAGMK